MRMIKMLFNDEDTYELLEKLNNYKPPHDKIVVSMVIFGIVYIISMGFMMYEVEMLKVKLHKSNQTIQEMVETHKEFKTRFGLQSWE